MNEVTGGGKSGCRVLVTRPLPDAVITAARLQAAGYRPVLLPVSETVPTDYGFDALAAEVFDAVAVTSANALRHANAAKLSAYHHLQVYAVGEKTANVTRESGFDKIYAGDGWGLHLGQYVAQQQNTGSHVLYLTGKVRRPDFEAQLAAAGIHVHIAETYDTKPVSYDDAQLAKLVRAEPADIILLYSAVAAKQFAALDRQVQNGFLNQAKHIFCLSQRIAAELPDHCQARICISDTPDEAGLLRLLADA